MRLSLAAACLASLFVLALAGCEGAGSEAPGADVVQLDAAPETVAPDLGGDPDTRPDLTAPDAAADLPPWLALPVEPPPLHPTAALFDRPFVQEFNHTYNTQPPELGAVVALVLPPEGLEGFARPTLVAPRGPWRPDGAGGLVLQALPAEASDVVAAASAFGALWLLTGEALYEAPVEGEPRLVATLPAGEGRRLFADEGGLWIVGTAALGRMEAADSLTWDETSPGPGAVLEREDLRWLAGEGWLRAVDPTTGDERWHLSVDVGEPIALLADRTLPVPLDLVLVGTQGLVGLNLGAEGPVPQEVPLFAPARLPLAEARLARATRDGGFLVAAAGGVYRPAESVLGPEYRVYVPERWMPPGEVHDALEDPAATLGALHFATEGGVGGATRQEWTLADKIDTMIERIALRHNREGAVADSRLSAPGDLSTSIPWDSDNDGGWTCYWLLSECFRYKLTGAAEAKAHFDESLARMLSFRTLTGTEHFLARSVIRIEGCQLDDCDAPDDGEWFLSPDEEWWVKADTSNDEVTSHMFMMGHAYDLCADEAQREAIVAHVDGIVGGLVDNGYQLIDPQDGECTSYGQFDPFYVNQWFSGTFADGGRRSAQMLGALNLALYLTGDPKYADAKRELIEEHHYHENVRNLGDATIYGFCAGSGDCDELGFQAMVPLLRYEADPALREIWLAGWRQHYEHLVSQEDPFWDLANALFTGEPFDTTLAGRWYERYPVDLVRWPILNAGWRQDLAPPPPYYEVQKARPEYRQRNDGHPLPADERPNIRHNTPQFEFTGGWGAQIELDGGDALFPYWYGRYYGLVDPECDSERK